MTRDKRPAFQFYPGDWLRDAALRFVSVAARGLWVDMLCLMHDCEPYGHLQIGGVPVNEIRLSAMTGVDEKTVKNLLAELERAEVFSRAKNGAIFCRRMVKDAAISKKRKRIGKLGGNPVLLKGLVNSEHKLFVADADAEIVVVDSSLEEGAGETKILTPQQVDVKRVLDAWDRTLPPSPGLAAKWNSQIGVAAVIEIIQLHPEMNVKYIAGCVNSAAERKANAPARTDRRGPAGQAPPRPDTSRTYAAQHGTRDARDTVARLQAAGELPTLPGAASK